MKYLITTLALRDEYANNAITQFTQASKKLTGDFSITTEKSRHACERVHINVYTGKWEINKSRYGICLNLKCIPIQFGANRDYDFIIYHDGDWRARDELTDEKLNSLYNYMVENNIDMCGERPMRLGDAKKDKDCIFRNKIIDYNLLSRSKWDDAQVMNEQFLAFRNSDKLKVFCQQWEMFLHWCIYHNLDGYPDGVEIGISALEAGMKIDLNSHSWGPYVRNCWEFNDKFNTQTYIRF